MEEIKKLVGREITLVDSGNTAIDKALEIAKKRGKTKVLIQDQGGWIHYKKAPKKLGMEIIEIKTDYGLVDLNELMEKADEKCVLLINSMPGYCATEKMIEIEAISNEKEMLLINDVCGTIGQDEGKIGHILIGSFGEWKPIEANYGGFITEKTKSNGSKWRGPDFSFCNPKNFQKMFEKGSQRFSARNTVTDCSSMMNGMIKKMMDMCCPPNSTEFKDKADSQKDHEA